MSLFVPADPIELEKRIPWAHDSGTLFSRVRHGIGVGEYSLVSHLLGIDPNAPTEVLETFLGGQSETHDISITPELIARVRSIASLAPDGDKWRIPVENLGTYEVKDARHNNIRLGEEGMQEVSRNYEFFREVSKEVRSAVIHMSEYLELVLPVSTWQELDGFVMTDCPCINNGSLPRGRALGARGQLADAKRAWSGQKFGLFQAVSVLSRLKRAKMKDRPRNWKFRVYNDDQKTNLFLTMHPKNAVGTLKMNMKDDGPVEMRRKVKGALVDHLGLNALEADLMYHLEHPVFDDPESVVRNFSTLAQPSIAFSNVDYLALVTEKDVEIIPRKRLDERLTLIGIVQGSRPCYSVSERAA